MYIAANKKRIDANEQDSRNANVPPRCTEFWVAQSGRTIDANVLTYGRCFV